MGDVPDADPHGGHPGHAQHVPGARVGSAVEQVGAGYQLVLKALGQDTSTRGVVAAAWIPEVEGGDAVRQRTLGAVDVQGDDEVRTHVVRELGARSVVRKGGGRSRASRARQQHLGTQGRKASLDPGCHGLAQLSDQGEIGVVAIAWVEYDDLVGDARPQLGEGQVLAQSGGVAARHRAHESVEGPEGVRPAGAVGVYADPTLKLPQCGICLLTEEAIRASRGEPELVQAALQFSDIVPGHEVPGHVGEYTITEMPARLIEMSIGVRADDAVDADTALLLKGAHGPVEIVIKDLRVWYLIAVEAELGQAGANLGDGNADIAPAQQRGT